MITTDEMTSNNDSDLVTASLSGNRDAFGQIVTRYQSLVCSLAYSATGNLSQSEDLAQETFLTAWKQLGGLREPAKLRSWLCGIARNVTNNWLRRNGREPSHAAELLETVQESPAPEPLPHDQTISNEEAAILWRSLERIPEIYREPLVLFYREHQSIENVAAALDLNEDAVKQRLSRGRKLLHEQVLAFVEGALERTNPGKAFTIGVLAALPIFATSASAATVGVAAAKGSGAAKASALLGLSGAVLGPLVGILGGWLGVRASLMNAQTERERQFIRKTTRSSLIMITLFCVAVFCICFLSASIWKAHPWLLTCGLVGLSVAYVIALLTLILRHNRQLAQIRAEDIAAGLAQPRIGQRRGEEFEYRSAWTLLGLPLIHVCFGPRADGKRRVAKGWIAIGEIACGGIAFGGLSLGLVSVGGLGLGVFSMGGAAVGLLAFGGIGIGWWAIGGCAIGYLAYGGSAIGWHAAMGGSAMAHEFAWGGAAFAPHANDEAASVVAKSLPFFKHAQAIMVNAGLLVWVPMGFLIWQTLYLQKRARARKSE